jgi:hypothetical protein
MESGRPRQACINARRSFGPVDGGSARLRRAGQRIGQLAGTDRAQRRLLCMHWP